MIPPGCQPTCDDKTMSGCDIYGPPVLTCICASRLVLQGKECIPEEECPCDRIDGIQLEVRNNLVN